MVFTRNSKSGNYATEEYVKEYVKDAILNTEDMKKLFVTKIPKDSTDEDLKSFFENICGGSVTEHVVIRKETAKNHFGFFTFETSHLVDEVIFKEKELVFNGTTLEANRAVPKQHYLTGAHHKTKKLFIAGIPKTGISEEELKEHFEARHDPKYGTIESVQFIKKKDEEGNAIEENKGFGFVNCSSEHFADTMSIQHATIQFNGQKLELKKSDRDGQPGGGRGGQRGGGRGGQRGGGGRGYQSSGGQRGGRGGGHYSAAGGGNSSYGGYSGYGGYGDQSYDQSWGYGGYYDGYGMYPQYGVSSAVPRGRGAKGASRGGARGGARGGRGGKRYTPYAK